MAPVDRPPTRTPATTERSRIQLNGSSIYSRRSPFVSEAARIIFMPGPSPGSTRAWVAVSLTPVSAPSPGRQPGRLARHPAGTAHSERARAKARPRTPVGLVIATRRRAALRQHDARGAIQGARRPGPSLYERFLGGFLQGLHALRALPAVLQRQEQDRRSPQGLNRPVLIIVDEILDYVGNGLDGANKPELAAQDMAFLRALGCRERRPARSVAGRDDRLGSRQDLFRSPAAKGTTR